MKRFGHGLQEYEMIGKSIDPTSGLGNQRMSTSSCKFWCENILTV